MSNETKTVKAPKTAKRVAGQPAVVANLKAKLVSIEDKDFGNKTAVFSAAIKHEKLNNEQDRCRIRREDWIELCKNAGLKGIGIQSVAGKITAELEVRSFIKGEEYTNEDGSTYKSGYKAIKDEDGETIDFVNNDESIADGTELCRLYVVDLVIPGAAKDSALAFQKSERDAQTMEARTLARMSKSERVLYALMKNSKDPNQIATYLQTMENLDSSKKSNSNTSSKLAQEPVVAEDPEGDE